MTISIKVVGIEKVQQYLINLPRPLKIAGMRAASEYFIGDESHGLKHEPAEKFVSRKSAYGKVSDAPAGYFSWKQFRYVAWLTEGFTRRYQRTHAMSNDWDYTDASSDWSRVKIFNQVPGVDWVMGEGQARQPARVGWIKASIIMARNTAGAVRAAHAAINAYLARKG
jgi:hypothetical protein